MQDLFVSVRRSLVFRPGDSSPAAASGGVAERIGSCIHKFRVGIGLGLGPGPKLPSPPPAPAPQICSAFVYADVSRDFGVLDRLEETGIGQKYALLHEVSTIFKIIKDELVEANNVLTTGIERDVVPLARLKKMHEAFKRCCPTCQVEENA